MESFKTKFLKGAFWNFIEQAGSQGINFLIVLILARLLNSEQFGLLGMVTVITGFVGYFSELGLQASLIKEKTIDQIDCSTVFWTGIVFSMFVYVLLFFLAPVIARFYLRPELESITRVLAVVFPVGAFSYLPIVLETKKLCYDRLAKAKLISLSISGVVAIILAFSGYGVWALVYQQILLKICEVLALFYYINYRPQFVFSWARFKHLITYGIHIMAHNFIKFFSENIDYLLVGKLLGASALGIYTIAFRISKYPIEKITQIIGKILFPAFASIHGDKEMLARVHANITISVAITTIPILSILFSCTEDFVVLTISDKWIDAVPFVKILVVYLFFMSISMSDEVILSLTYITKLNLVKSIASFLFMICAFLAVPKYGLEGIAVVYTVVFSCYWIVIKIITMRVLEVSLFRFFKEYSKFFYYLISILATAFCINIIQLSQSHFFNLFLTTLIVFSVAFVMLCSLKAIKRTAPYFSFENLYRK